MFNHEERIAVLERIVKDLDRMYFVLLFAVCIELKHGYTYVNRDGKMVPIDTDAERLRRCRKRVLAVDSALKCLIAEYPAAALRITLMLLPDTTEPE